MVSTKKVSYHEWGQLRGVVHACIVLHMQTGEWSDCTHHAKEGGMNLHGAHIVFRS